MKTRSLQGIFALLRLHEQFGQGSAPHYFSMFAYRQHLCAWKDVLLHRDWTECTMASMIGHSFIFFFLFKVSQIIFIVSYHFWPWRAPSSHFFPSHSAHILFFERELCVRLTKGTLFQGFSAWWRTWCTHRSSRSPWASAHLIGGPTTGTTAGPSGMPPQSHSNKHHYYFSLQYHIRL